MNQLQIQTHSTLDWKKLLISFILVPFSILLLPLLILACIFQLVRNQFRSKKLQLVPYTEEDAIKEFHMDPPGWEAGLEDEQ